MGFLSNLFGAKYDDQRLAEHAQHALEADPMIIHNDDVVITSKQGIITLEGRVPLAQERTRAEQTIRNSLQNAGLKYENLNNNIEVSDLSIHNG
jgi:osmotically-inducible protein OsmY